MAFPTPIITGTIIFILLGFVASIVGMWLWRTKKLSLDNTQCVGRQVESLSFVISFRWFAY